MPAEKVQEDVMNAVPEQGNDHDLEQQALTHRKALDVAVEHHTAGRLSQAESIYRQILPGVNYFFTQQALIF